MIAPTSLTQQINSGSLLVAMPVALLAGLISFASPCVLPLVPGYLSYVTGMTGSDLAEARRGRALLGTTLFVLGFSVVFVSFGAAFGYLGSDLLSHQAAVDRALGAVTVLLGLSFLGLIPRSQRDLRWLHRAPAPGLLAAPVLGVLFGVGWTPCIGPTLGAVQTLALDEGSAWRGAWLTFVYCLGLGLPFIATALGLRKALGAMRWMRTHGRLVMRAGGLMLCLLGVLLLTGTWAEVIVHMRTWTTNFTPSV